MRNRSEFSELKSAFQSSSIDRHTLNPTIKFSIKFQSYIPNYSVKGTCNDSPVPPTSVSPTLNSTSINDTEIVTDTVTASALKVAPTIDARHITCGAWGSNSYEPIYSCALPKEAALLGVTSIALTILNILCIFIMAIVVFKIKEVVPKAALSSGEILFLRQFAGSKRIDKYNINLLC